MPSLNQTRLAELLEQPYANKRDRGTNTVEVQITRLRCKIGKDRIQTLGGVGYRLVSPAGSRKSDRSRQVCACAAAIAPSA